MAPYRILSLDGGGCRAIIEATVISRLEEKFPDLLNQVDLFAGTSAGSILALSYAAGFSNKETTAFFDGDVQAVFKTSLLREFEDLNGSIGAKYGNEALREMLTKQFGTLKLRDLKKKVFVPAFQLDNWDVPPALKPSHGMSRRWVPRFFHNLNEAHTLDEYVVDVAMRSSAAPTYFPIYQGFVDGGVFANNPALCAVSAAINAGVNMSDIIVLSLSTGKDGLYLSEQQYKEGDWGLLQWAPQLTDLILDGGVEVTDYQCYQLLGERYMRVNPPLPKAIPLDCPNMIPELTALANAIDIQGPLEWMSERWCPDEVHPTPTHTPTTVPGVKESRLIKGCIVM